MSAKPFSKISVTEIIRDCGLNRKTFYYHFEDIYALLKWMFEEEALEVVKQFDLLVDYEDAIVFVMDYVEKNDYLKSCVYDSVCRDQMKDFFSTNFTSVVTSVIDKAENSLGKKNNPDFKAYVAKFYTEALSAMLLDLIAQKDKLGKEKHIKYLSSIVGTALTSIQYAEIDFE